MVGAVHRLRDQMHYSSKGCTVNATGVLQELDYTTCAYIYSLLGKSN